MSAGRNFLTNLGGNLVGLALFAALTPVYLNAIGPERYGVVALILSLSMYVATFNFGLGPALTYQIAGVLKDDVRAQSEAYWSAMALSTPVGLIASLLIFGALPVGLADLMHLTAAVRHELRGAFLPLVGIGLCTILSSNVRGVWTGRQAFLTLAVFTSLDTILTILVPVLTALYISSEIGALLYATLFTRLVLLFGSMAQCSATVLGGNWPRVSRSRIRIMMGYGGWVTMATLVETVLSSADRLILGTIVGARTIPIYSIPLSVTSRAMILPMSLLTAVFPKLVGSDAERESLLMDRTIRLIVLLTPGYALVVALSAPILRYWISARFADEAALILQIMAVALWFEGVAAIFYYQLNARGNARANFLIGAMIVVPYLTALAVGAWAAGAAGVAVAYLLRNIAILGARARWAGAPASSVRVIFVNFLPLAVVLGVAPHGWSAATPALFAAALVGVGLSCLACWWTRLPNLHEMLLSILPQRSAR